MTDDHIRIRVGDYEVGLMGLTRAMEEIAESHAERQDADVQEALLEKLSKKNYIPSSARRDYGTALVREFRKFKGQPYKDVEPKGLRIVVLGPGCSQCDRLEQTVMQVLTQMELPASLEHVTDIKEISKYGFVQTPALVINGIVVASGPAPSVKKVTEWITQAVASQAGIPQTQT
jgi:hypothetical protein